MEYNLPSMSAIMITYHLASPMSQKRVFISTSDYQNLKEKQIPFKKEMEEIVKTMVPIKNQMNEMVKELKKGKKQALNEQEKEKLRNDYATLKENYKALESNYSKLDKESNKIIPSYTFIVENSPIGLGIKNLQAGEIGTFNSHGDTPCSVSYVHYDGPMEVLEDETDEIESSEKENDDVLDV